MARVAFIVESLSSADHPQATHNTDLTNHLRQKLAQQLILGTTASRHDVLVASTFCPSEETPVDLAHLKFIFPFKNWNLWEVPKAAQALVEHRPQVIHFIDPFHWQNPKIMDARVGLAQTMKHLFKAKIILTYFNLNEKDLLSIHHRQLLNISDAITVADQKEKELLAKLAKGGEEKISLLNLPFLIDDQEPKAFWAHHFFKEFIYIPGSPAEHNKQLPTLLGTLAEVLNEFPHIGILFAGGLKNLSPIDRYKVQTTIQKLGLKNRCVFANLSPSMQNAMIRKSTAYLGSTLKLENTQGSMKDSFVRRVSASVTRINHSDFTNFHSLFFKSDLYMCIKFGVVPIMTSVQSQFDSHSWKANTNFFECEKDLKNLRSILKSVLSEDEQFKGIKSNLTRLNDAHSLDHLYNHLNRLYATPQSITFATRYSRTVKG